MRLILLLTAATLIVTLFTLLVMAYLASRADDTHQPVGPHPDDIEIKNEYARCTIRSDRAPEREWRNVRVQFFLPRAKQPVCVLTFDRWQRELLYGFEDSLVSAGFRRTASGNSQQMTTNFDEMQRFVVFTRETVSREK